MKKVEYKISEYKGGLVAEFEESHIVCKIVAKIGKVTAKVPEPVIDAFYAVNFVTTDLVFCGYKVVASNKDYEISLDTPVSASHIYITPQHEGIVVEDIEVYELEEDEDALTYPDCIDYDLKDNYFLDSVTFRMCNEGYHYYTVYTSINGKDFEKLYTKNDDTPCGIDGDVINAYGREARYVRINIEYYSAYARATIDDMSFVGKKSDSKPIDYEPIDIDNFVDSEYNVEITVQDTLNEVYGIIERTVGAQYTDWFDLEVVESKNGKYDYFELTAKNGKVNIKGNNGVSLAVGFNHYLKYFCNVQIVQTGRQNKMPSQIVLPNEKVYRETQARFRYTYIYCTHSYTMAFWQEEEWRRELDWLALNGINIILDQTAQEEVWRRFLFKIGYADEEIRRFVAGVPFFAWQNISNHSGFGGLMPNKWFKKRTELARRNQLIMRRLGMQPVIMGYYGTVPADISQKDPSADAILQGTWGSMQRPSMLRVPSESFNRYAKIYYSVISEVFGDWVKYFDCEPLYEGGRIADMDPFEVGRDILDQMLKYNPNAVWFLESWQHNPLSELLRGINSVENAKDHVIVMDIYAEKDPKYIKGKPGNPYHGYSAEFGGTPWMYGMLNIFGGRTGLHGHLDNLVNEMPKVFNNCKFVNSIGYFAEATENNPVLVDFFFEYIWQEDAKDFKKVDIDAWLNNFALRRYGYKSENLEKVWQILKNTVYKAEYNMLGQGAPESVVNARPALKIQAASTWGNSVIGYDKEDLKNAAKLLLCEFDNLKDNECYMYDVVSIVEQVLSNNAQDVHNLMVKAFENKDLDGFTKYSDEFLKIADNMDKITSCNKYYMLGRWLSGAKNISKDFDDYSKRLVKMNARMLITTWGSYNQAVAGGLLEYSNRQWSGLIKDYYKPRWVLWINNRKNELEGKPFVNYTPNDWFEMEWKFVLGDTEYKTEETQLTSKEILELI